ncbi:heterodisulfide reductase subunit A [Desulfohalotomaculum tongense]|uniref:FAD-dependent oxidoreductase n=1 Tax=Desulforadius tongensis TaxID=1216062 RepID=UPI00195EB953|nr:FAD-dependent oxidoreductase [Desulforadius tongensis]MBM7855634.1 heterodisulfide reductase subunit A [Desulforadius tongensis]
MSEHAGVKTKAVGAVLVVGGGIAGMQAASDLAESGFLVYMITFDDSLGGRMAKLDKTFPTNECSMCLLGPKMTGSLNQVNIKLLTRAKLSNLLGQPGRFTAVVERYPRYVDESRCTGCGQCAEVCPVKVADEFNGGLSQRRAIYKQFPQAVPNKFAIDKENCIGCMKCVKVCTAKAIDHRQQPEILELSVGAVILAPGFDSFDASLLGEYGMGYYPNVVSNIQFERMLSSTGPTGGRIYRPSDRKIPRRVAFIQCVGSRDYRNKYGAEYCSAVCCMASVKEAVIAKEHHPEMEVTIFYLDMRAHGKNFDRYVNRALAQGIKLQRCLISSVKEDPATGNLNVSYCEQGEVYTADFDMVVLGAGVRPPGSAGQLARSAGIELNRYGFARTGEFNPVETTRPGVFAAGGFIGPRDIPETVVNGSAAAAAAAELLSAARGSMEQVVRYPREKDLQNRQPRVGVFVCCCGSNIAGVVDVPAVVKYASSLPAVVNAWQFTYSCAQESLQRVKEIIEQYQLNRVVVAACSVRTHLPLFRETLKQAGLNQYYLEMANIRDQCSWVHRDYPRRATAKAKDLVAMAVGKVCRNQPLHLEPVPVEQKALVVGAGIAGMTASLSLADQGYGVYLVERRPYLGGLLNRLYLPQRGENPRDLLRQKIEAVINHPNITVYKEAELTHLSGRIGSFHSTLQVGEKTVHLHHGVVITATGNCEAPVRGYLYGKDNRVITRLEMEKYLGENKNIDRLNTVVFIQCVESRQQGREYCSRTCCVQTVRQALALKELNPGVNVYVLYRDVRTYGFMERDYRLAREKGVIFINYDLDKPPVLRSGSEAVDVDVYDPACREELQLAAELVVLATAAVPSEGVEKLAGLLKIPVNEDGFLVETHAKLAPLDVPAPGVFICGAAHSPQSIGEAMAQGRGAAARAATILSKAHLLAGGAVARVLPEKCAACLTCVRVCPYGVPRIGTDNVAEISAVQCQGCGTCAGACPNRAITLEHYRSEQLTEKVRALFNGEVASSG